MSNGKIGVAIVGCGYWGVNYVRVFSELANARVAVVCDQRQERLDEIRRRFPSVAVATDLQVALSRDDVDAAVICTGATTHYALARQCLEAGKHIMIEKPMTTTSADGERLNALAWERDRILMVGHTFVYNTAVHKVKESLEGVGEVYYLYSRRTNMGPIRPDVNALWDLAPHDVSIFNYWLGSSPEWVSAVGARVLHNGHEDVGFVSLHYPGGIVGNIHVSWADPAKVRELVVVGSKQRIVFNDLNASEPVRVYHKGVAVVDHDSEASFAEHQLTMRDGDIVSPRVAVTEPLKTECNHFIDCVLSHKPPLTGGKEGLDVVRVMEAIDESLAHNGAPAYLKPLALAPTVKPTLIKSVQPVPTHPIEQPAKELVS